MNPVYLLLGGVLLVAVIVDILWTTLWVDGGSGPLSGRLSTALWRGLRRTAKENPRLLSLAGPLILVLTLSMWVGLIWTGWTFLFAAGENALIDTRDGGTVTWAGRAWYVAYTMFTDGNGDFTPNGGVWQMASSLTTASGMLFVTLGVSYVLSILGAVANKRAFAKSVTGLGDRSESFVRTGWNGEEFHDLDLPLNTLSSSLNTLAEQHKSYPILHYYYSEEVSDSSAKAVVVFDEALTVFQSGVPDEVRPNPALLESARSSTHDYLNTLNEAYIDPADDVPPPPDLEQLREDGIPTVTDDAFAEDLSDLEEHRRKLLATVDADARDWPSSDG